MTHESQKSDVAPVVSDGTPPSLPLQTVAWRVTPPVGKSWVTDDNPERYRALGYKIVPLVPETEACEAISSAVETEHRAGAEQHADDLIALARIIGRLKIIIENDYDYDNRKILEDLMKWGFVEPHAGSPLLPTAEGRRLDNILELEWLRTRARRGMR
ncbi:hypothetical protein [Acetobacter fallax]|uniref:Uncharacterized protein n=1 Tax=Acetobacter fallax TaxID=1737473 RepID=A0ABX0K956_9PROT|nr:hypothetical protein [Acetobacter fallax]NHO32932.1 hypothetical protein [Acetobacter fallax]NHO36553.1 hypothetical protein [Acetobacter fallax]